MELDENAAQVKSYETVEQIRRALVLGLPITDADREREFLDTLEIAKDKKYKEVIDKNDDGVGTVDEFLRNLWEVRLLALGITDEDDIRQLKEEYERNIITRIDDDKNFEKGDKAVFGIESIIEAGKDDQYLERNIDNEIVIRQGVQLFERYDRIKYKEMLESFMGQNIQQIHTQEKTSG